MRGPCQTIQEKWRANQARWTILLIAAVALGGIACMCLIVLIIVATR